MHYVPMALIQYLIIKNTMNKLSFLQDNFAYQASFYATILY